MNEKYENTKNYEMEFSGSNVAGEYIDIVYKYDTPDFVEETGGVSGNLSVKKNVLWINLEGAGGGDLVKNAFPDDGVVKGLLPRSRYAWNGLESEHIDDTYTPTAENAIACASMLTGNIPMRHGIADETYLSEVYFDPDYDESMKAYPGFSNIL